MVQPWAHLGLSKEITMPLPDVRYDYDYRGKTSMPDVAESLMSGLKTYGAGVESYFKPRSMAEELIAKHLQNKINQPKADNALDWFKAQMDFLKAGIPLRGAQASLAGSSAQEKQGKLQALQVVNDYLKKSGQAPLNDIQEEEEEEEVGEKPVDYQSGSSVPPEVAAAMQVLGRDPTKLISPEKKKFSETTAKKRAETISNIESNYYGNVRNYQDAVRLKEIIKKHPEFFGPGVLGMDLFGPSYRSRGAIGNTPEYGEAQSLMGPLVQQMASALSNSGAGGGRNPVAALEFAKKNKVGFEDQPNAALGKIDTVTEEMYKRIQDAFNLHKKYGGKGLKLPKHAGYEDIPEEHIEEISELARKYNVSPKKIYQASRMGIKKTSDLQKWLKDNK